MAEDSKYKDTIHLPQTEFAMQAHLAKREPDMLARWEHDGVYAGLMAAREGASRDDSFYFLDGPPYANGDIHIGHAVNKVLKDMVVKAERLGGKRAPFVPGWDCHGLPIELMVEKKFGKVGEKLTAAEFRAHCREYAGEQVKRQKADFKRLGILADWDKPYLTMQPAYEAEQLRVLSRICERGHVVRGFKPVHWCLDCGSSLAEAEVEYQDKQSTAVYVAFPAVLPSVVHDVFHLPKSDEAVGFVVWTTTPWTLPANQAVCVGPFDYALIRISDRLLVVAADLVGGFAAKLGAEAEVVGVVPGEKLTRIKLTHPFALRNVPIIEASHVTLEAGTGLVHTAPDHGVEDYVAGRAHGIAPDGYVSSNGTYVASVPHVAGLHVRKAEEHIFDALRPYGLILHKEIITHSYPHCWRHKTPLIFRATPQWFISMDKVGLRRDALAAIKATRWIPAWGEERISKMIEGRPDWCISRQRFWGVPLALFVHRETQEPHPDTAALLLRVADAVEAKGLEAWFGSTPADWGVDETCFEKCTDTLDVWFDSGVAQPASFIANGQAVPEQTDIYLEGSDQHRGWFHSSLLTRVATHGVAPYKSVLTHGFTVDEQGRKMSKSLGNVVAPQKVISTLGADVLRLWVASSDYSGEIAISDNLLKRTADAYRRIRNTARYLLGSLHGFDPATDSVAVEDMVAVDRWAISEAARVQAEIQSAYADREFHRVYHTLHNYCVNDLGGLYLDLLKDRLYTLPEKSIARRSAQTALLHIAEGLVRWIAPVLSFTADEIWRLLPGDRSASVFVQGWWSFPATRTVDVNWSKLVMVRDGVRKVLEDERSKGLIGSSLQAEVEICADGDTIAALRTSEDELRFWLQTSAVVVSEGSAGIAVKAQPSPHAKCDRCWHYREDVGQIQGHETICGRCVSNIEGPGETRRWF
ncbi:MAG: isoleucine--tRNA ligase [Stagnimonas sp.]|nr:isoleucine--tRNA ligase [Stagnimonas sp.]